MRQSDVYMHQLFHHHWFREWLATWSVPNHYVNQCWNIVNSNLRNKFWWNFKWNSYIFSQENAFENVVYEMAASLSGPQYIDATVHLKSYAHGSHFVVVWYRSCLHDHILQGHFIGIGTIIYIDGLVQERHNSSTLALELHLFCTNPLISTTDWTLTNMGR